MKHSIKIALTGIMGAGKSSAAALIKEAGITVIDCDEVNRHLLKRDEIGYQRVLETFGEAVLSEDRSLNTQALSDLVFTDLDKKQQLEAIMHPLIQAAVIEQMDQCQEPLVVVEVPLLFESHWESLFDEIWVVRSDEEILLERLHNQRNVSRKEALRRLSNQLSQEEKCARADVVFHNNEDLKSLKSQIDIQLQRLREE